MSGLSTWRPLILLAVALSLLKTTFADVITGVPDQAPPGFEEWESPVVVPAAPTTPSGDWASAVEKARNFVSQLTLEEKVNLTTGTGVQDRFVFILFHTLDSPTGINTAATWDKNLMYQRGQAMGNEHMTKGVNVALGPMMNMGRAPAAGRNWEGFGADPFLAGVAAAETVQGMQSQRVIATAKHLIGNEQEHFRGGSLAAQIYSSNIDDKTMHEFYLWPFAESVHAGVGAVMCSYNKINQTQACQNSKVMNGLIKEELGFRGFIMSDWAAMINGVQPALAGLDMNMPGFLAYGLGPQAFDPVTSNNSFWGAALVEAVNNGSVPESRVDDMVTRLMTSFFKMNQDQNYPAVNFDQLTQDTFNSQGVMINEHVNAQGDHYKVIREIGGASAVLLKNVDNALPLNVNKLKRISIIGSDSGPNFEGANGCTDRGCDQGHLAMGWGSGTANFPYLVDPLSAIQTYIHSQDPTVVVDFLLDDFNYGQAQTIAAQADTCLVFVNADSGEGYINVGGNQGDRNNLTTWNAGDVLIQMTAAVCENTLVVSNFVGPVILESWIDNPNVTAVLHAGLSGQESGNGITDVLFGAVNPSGRLPYTIAKQATDYPADVLYTSSMDTPQITYTEGVNVDYRFFDANNITPRFEFGFGLSYTKFAYNGLNIRPGSDNTKRDLAASPSPAVTPSSGPEAVSSILNHNATSAFSAVASSTLASVSTPLVQNATSVPAASPANATTVSGASPANATLPAPIPSTSSNVTIPNNSTNATTTPVPATVSSNPGGPASLYDTAYFITYAITNTGGVDGNEVSQVYLGFPEEANQPPKVLRGFDRTFIQQGHTANIQIPLRNKDISYWNVVEQRWVIPKGAFTVYVGSSSRNIHLTGTLVVS
ncbi:hypothetical protein Clacol_002231 [Clathrus columnatus]|uniref:beta-glucosidase n=1 Tax=Clathrus columnatus TaxID=1419009 RepID=A0AAV5A084_9AGAM|nr:hypothetical protein Clacol_002231 [Clathrus columnatus]